MIHFDEKTHRYFNDSGEEYISVTTLLGQEFPFDAKKIADKVRKMSGSRYSGMSVTRILQEWAASASHGQEVHNAVEQFIKEGIYIQDSALVPLVEQFRKVPFKGRLESEVLLYDDEYKIAGRTDILEHLNDYISVWDIKTCRKMDESKLIKYSMQLDIYSRLAERMYKKSVRPGGLLHYEDYVMKRSKSKLKILYPLSCGSSVDEILDKRLRSIK